ncbi:tumor protein D54-like isoform 1-T2 [Synchiropus picturatus]
MSRAATELSEDEAERLRMELAKVEEEIHALRQTLLTKERTASEIRRQLGLSPLSCIRQNLSRSWESVQCSAPYQTASATLDDISHSDVYLRTRDGLSHAGNATSSALSNVGVAITRRLAGMRSLPLPGPPRFWISNQLVITAFLLLSLLYLSIEICITTSASQPSDTLLY